MRSSVVIAAGTKSTKLSGHQRTVSIARFVSGSKQSNIDVELVVPNAGYSPPDNVFAPAHLLAFETLPFALDPEKHETGRCGAENSSDNADRGCNEDSGR